MPRGRLWTKQEDAAIRECGRGPPFAPDAVADPLARLADQWPDRTYDAIRKRASRLGVRVVRNRTKFVCKIVRDEEAA